MVGGPLYIGGGFMGVFGDWANRYFEAGLSVIPVDGKRAFTSGWNEWCDKLPSEDLVTEWISKYPNHNIGLCTGAASGIVALDIDTDDKGILEIIASIAPPSPCSKRGAKGITYFYKFTDEIKTSCKVKGNNLFDILAGGSQTVIPPSWHPTANVAYSWIGKSLLDLEDELPTLGKDTVNKLMRALAGFDVPESEVKSEGRNNSLKAYVAALSDKKTIEELVEAALKYDECVFGGRELFKDKSEFKSEDAYYNAFEFVSNIKKAVMKRKLERGASVSPEIKMKPAKIDASQLSRSAIEEVLPHWSWKKTADGFVKVNPKCTLENLEALLNHLGVIVRYNVISKQEEIIIPGKSFSLDNQENASFAEIQSWLNLINMPRTHTLEYITTIADKNQYNPIVTWIESKPWDGINRLDDFFETIKVIEQDKDIKVKNLKRSLIKRWMISAIAGAFNPRGVSAHGVLVLQGDQYLGKTMWFKKLAPDDMNVVADGKILRPDDKDSVNQIVRYWIVELGELDATFRKSDIAQLKSFITKDSDLFRRAYAKKDSNFARRTVFFGSVNPKQFLNDPTGNRRFWTIECEHINYNHNFDMQQVWAEVLNLYRSGESWFLNKDEMLALNDHNDGFTAKDPVEEMVLTKLKWGQPEAYWSWRTATEILGIMNKNNPNMSDVKKVSQQVFKLNKGRRIKTNGIMKLFCPDAYNQT